MERMSSSNEAFPDPNKSSNQLNQQKRQTKINHKTNTRHKESIRQNKDIYTGRFLPNETSPTMNLVQSSRGGLQDPKDNEKVTDRQPIKDIELQYKHQSFDHIIKRMTKVFEKYSQNEDGISKRILVSRRTLSKQFSLRRIQKYGESMFGVTAKGNSFKSQNNQLFMPARQHLKDDYKQRQKQFAKVFIYCGYGISLTKKHFIDQFNPVCYYTQIKALLCASFHYLERVLVRKCQKVVQRLSSKSVQKIAIELRYCRNWMGREDLDTYFALVKGVCGLETGKVTGNSVEKLYETIMRRCGVLVEEKQEQDFVSRLLKETQGKKPIRGRKRR